MAYTKQTWVDRVVQYARRYTKTDIDANTVELVPEPGTVTAEGTAITASRMNNIENEIEFLSNRHATTANTGNAYTLTITNSKYNYDVGHTIVFTANATNTGGATLNVNGLGAKTFKKEIEGSLIDLFYGDIAINRMYEAFYDGTYFILKRPSRRDEFYQASSVGTDAYAVSLSNEMIYNFSVYNGLTVRMKVDVNNTGAATLAVNGAAAKTIKRVVSGILVDLLEGDMVANGIYTLIYDADNSYYILQNPSNNIVVSQLYNTVGSYSFYTPVSGTYNVILVGGGGGGGGSSNTIGAGGGGAGEYLRKQIFINRFNIINITVGGGGSGGSNTGVDGNNGNGSSIVVNGTTYSVIGGYGGKKNVTSPIAGGAGGNSVNMGAGGGGGSGNGYYGGAGGNNTSVPYSGGNGYSSRYGGGGAGHSGNGANADGSNSGSGGSGLNTSSIILDFPGTGTGGGGSNLGAQYGCGGGGGGGYGGNGGVAIAGNGCGCGGGGYGSGSFAPEDFTGLSGKGYGAGGHGGYNTNGKNGASGLVLIYFSIEPGGTYW